MELQWGHSLSLMEHFILVFIFQCFYSTFLSHSLILLNQLWSTVSALCFIPFQCGFTLALWDPLFSSWSSLFFSLTLPTRGTSLGLKMLRTVTTSAGLQVQTPCYIWTFNDHKSASASPLLYGYFHFFAGLLSFTLLHYALAITAVVLFFIYYTTPDDCTEHKVFISLNLIFCVIVSVVSILPKIQVPFRPLQNHITWVFVEMFCKEPAWHTMKQIIMVYCCSNLNICKYM